MRLKAFFSMLLLSCSLLSEENSLNGFSFHMTIDKDSVEVGNELAVLLHTSYPEGYRVDHRELRTNLLEYYGYGLLPFSLVKEELLKNTPTETMIRYRLMATLEGHFDLSFGVVTFYSDLEKNRTLLSPTLPIHVILGAFDKDYLPPPPDYLLLTPLLPATIDPELKAELLSGTKNLHSEKLLWKRLFFFKRVVLVAFLSLFILGISYFASIFLEIPFIKKEYREPDGEAVLKTLYRKMTNLYLKQKKGEIDPEEGLISMEKALVDSFAIRFKLPASTMTVEEFREALLKSPSFKGNLQDIDSLFRLSLRVKFAKKKVTRKEAMLLMEKSLKAFSNST